MTAPWLPALPDLLDTAERYDRLVEGLEALRWPSRVRVYDNNRPCVLQDDITALLASVRGER